MFIDESDIYICGYIGNSVVYWKNGVEHTLADVDYATSIFSVNK